MMHSWRLNKEMRNFCGSHKIFASYLRQRIFRADASGMFMREVAVFCLFYERKRLIILGGYYETMLLSFVLQTAHIERNGE